MKTIKDTASFIKKIRHKLMLNQRQLAKLLNTHFVNINKYENGITKPPGTIILELIELEKNYVGERVDR